MAISSLSILIAANAKPAKKNGVIKGVAKDMTGNTDNTMSTKVKVTHMPIQNPGRFLNSCHASVIQYHPALAGHLRGSRKWFSMAFGAISKLASGGR